MIFTAEIVKQIKAGKRSMVRLPVKAGESECRHKVGRVYAVKTARDREASVHITITEVRQERHDSELVWILRFVKGDVTDKPRLLAARPGLPHGDYVSDAARAMRGEGEAVQGRILDQWALEGRERASQGMSEEGARLLDAVGKVRLEAARQGVGSAQARKRLKTVEHHLRLWHQESRLSA